MGRDRRAFAPCFSIENEIGQSRDEIPQQNRGICLARRLRFKRRMGTELEIAERKNAELRAVLAEQAERKRRQQAQRNAELAEQRRKLSENKAEILFVRQALQARRIEQAMAETPFDRIRRLEQSNYWLSRLVVEYEPIDYELVDAAPSTEPTWSKPTLKDKRGTHDEECVCKRCVFRFRDEQEENRP
jgi:hypothetical protein